MANERQYGDGSDSSIGATQFNDFYWQKKALIEAKKEAYFGQLADTTSMPKHMGKKIKQYHYLPLLDDANINDQGIDAAGAISEFKATFRFLPPGISNDADVPGGRASNGENLVYVTGEGTGAAAAVTAAKSEPNLVSSFAKAGYAITWVTDYPGTLAALVTAGWAISDDTTDTIVGLSYIAPVFDGGNLYGSSKDVGVIAAKLPALSEVGGRVNRVGFRRVELEGSIEKFGFFDEYTQESMDFDTDSELMMHVNREMISGANEMTEDALQIDLLNAAGVVRFGGIATQTSEVTGATEGTLSVPTYEDLMRLSIDLDNNRTPKHTTLITGTRMVDTKTVQAARYMFIGSELIPMVKKMAGMDTVVGSAFTSVEKYAEAGSVARGEIGQIDQFKIIVVPEMLHWAGVGAAEQTNPGYRTTGGNYDVYPMLVVGDKSFTTIGFQTDGKTVKFKIKHSKPGDAISYSKDDPFGEMGFMSIKWWYGTMILRSERIAVVKCVAEY